MRGLFVSLIMAISGTFAQANENLLDFLGGQGCVIGPGSDEILQAAGFDPAALSTLQSQGSAQGNWTLLPREICTIRLPDITSDLTLDDVRPFLSAADEYAEFDNMGCFLKTDLMQKDLIAKGWSADRAFWGYITIVGQGLVNGDWTFYTDTVLQTPIGFQYIGGGDCGAVEGVDMKRANHPVLARTFGEYVRESAPLIPCERGGTLMHTGWSDIMERLSDGQNTNAWVTWEMSVIAMAAGWYDGMSATEKGTPRAPMCYIP